MKPKLVLTLTGILAILFGLALASVPSQMLESFGLTAEPSGLVLSRDLGVVLVAIGVLNLMARETTDVIALRAILVGNLLVQVLQIAVDTYHILSDQIGPQGWAGVGMHALLALLFVLALAYKSRVEPVLEGTPAPHPGPPRSS